MRLYRCRACGRGFTPGPRAMRNKTYPLNEIFEALTAYNRGLSLEDTARRLSSRHGHTVNPATISRWLAAHPGITTYRRLRARGLKLFKPGITAYLDNGGSLENAQAMAAHESPRTTKLYDRTDDQITLDEVEKIGI